MKARPDVDFEVRWFPFQLNPQAPEQPKNKMQSYMEKFGRSRQEIEAMSNQMKERFDDVGLPYKFTDKALVANTFEAHRVLTAAYQKGGAAAQDRAVESIFHSYFAEELAPNDPQVLKAAAEAAGLDSAAIVSDKTIGADETRREFALGQQFNVHGVPHFVIRADGSSKGTEISGAQPPQEFARVIASVAK